MCIRDSFSTAKASDACRSGFEASPRAYPVREALRETPRGRPPVTRRVDDFYEYGARNRYNVSLSSPPVAAIGSLSPSDELAMLLWQRLCEDITCVFDRDPAARTVLEAVSYTHLDVYKRQAKAVSGSTIQNSARWRLVLEFSARKVGPKV